MTSLLRTSTRLVRISHPRALLPTPSILTHRTYAQESYGNSQSGHPKSSAPNPKADLEHPGPEAPASKASPNKSSSSSPSPSSSSPSSSDPSSTKSPAEGTSSSYPETSEGGKPAINNPGTAPEEKDEEVKRHNKEMEERYEKPTNQIDGDGKVEGTGDGDGKVEKGFWKGES